MRKRLFKTAAAFALSAAVLTSAVTASSVPPYRGYTYDSYSEAVPAPIGYYPEKTYLPDDIGVESLKGASDMQANGNELYIADTQRNRIAVLNSDFKLLREYKRLSGTDGKVYELNAPQGVSVTGDKLVICNTGAAQVLVADLNGTVSQVYNAPIGETVDKDYAFKPVRAVIDSHGYAYIRSDGDLQGLLCYEENGNFLGYYGANKVKLSASMMLEYLYKQILSREATDSMVRFVPAEVTAVDIASDGFLYVVTQAKNESDRTDRLRKLNALGDNILNSSNTSMLYDSGIYGDIEIAYTKGNTVDTRLIDVCVDADGFIAVLDQTYSRVFIYDQESNLISVFGAKGDRAGAVQTASSLELFGGKYVILDSARGALVTYSPTEYVKLLMTADTHFLAGRYTEAYDMWREVLTYDGTNLLAFKGIGKALIEQERYSEALTYLKRGQDRVGYSLAMQEYRKEYIRDNWQKILIISAAVIAVLIIIVRLIRKKLGIKKKRNSIKFE